VIADGHQYRVEVNGRLASTWLGDRNLRGHIGLQNHDEGSRVRYRTVVLGELREHRAPAAGPS
jgi:hypothetical protein